MYLEPPDLWRKVDGEEDVFEEDARPVSGLMAPYVGRRYSADEIWVDYCRSNDIGLEDEPESRPRAKRIRAFDVPALADAVFISHRFCDVSAAITALLSERLPGIPWPQAPFNPWGAIKYALLHETMPAPPDETTGQRMVIELYGGLESLNGQRASRMRFNAFHPVGEDEMDTLDLGEMRFRISHATYANTDIPGIGVPFYM